METTLQSQSDKQLAAQASSSARQIWLAGLGAYIRDATEGNNVFATLVAQGEAVQNRIRKALEDRVDQVKVPASDARSKLERIFDERIASTLQSLAVPSNDDIEALSQQVQELSATVQTLREAERSVVEVADR